MLVGRQDCAGALSGARVVWVVDCEGESSEDGGAVVLGGDVGLG